MIIEGNVSVKAAVLGNKRSVERVIVDEKKHDKDTSWILHRCEASGKTHGGLIAECGNRQYQDISACLNENPFLCVLEGVEDPFNLGYVIRTLYSAGCSGLIIRNRDWSNVESTIMKSSAGASEYLNIVLSDDIPSLIKDVKKHDVKCFAEMRKDAISCFDADYTGPLLIAIGGEMRGLSKGVLEQMDQNIYIPYANDFHMALNASSATAVLAFEVLRMRNNCI